ncbi:MAG: hypothetical protein KUG81_01455 [Gammaproteobacteria bacterium]|nr:hypothetical protein [Gammaproteobacteria bacterium]
MIKENVIKLFVVDSYIQSLSQSGKETLKKFMMKKHGWNTKNWRAYHKIYKEHLITLNDALKCILDVVPGRIPEAVEGYKCPNCKEVNLSGPETNIVAQTKPLFTGDYKEFDHEPGLWWIEVIKCKCGTTYFNQNGA